MESSRDTLVEIIDSTARGGSPEITPILLRCLVCGRQPASNNYGSITCTSCKVFFLRATTVGAGIAECKNHRLCSKQNFQGKGRSKCIPCRYAKCIEVGMIPEITARRQGCSLREKRAGIGLRSRKALDYGKEVLGTSSSSPSPDSRELRLVSTSFMRPIGGQMIGTIDDIKGLVELERFLLNDEPCTSVSFDFEYRLDEMTMREVLNNPSIVCERVPVGFHLSTNHQVPENCVETMGGRTFARSLVLISDWIRSIPEFWLLDEVDRVNLCCQQYLRQIIYTDFYYTYKYNFEGFMVLLGTRVSADDLKLFKDLADSMGFLIKYGLTTVIPSMRKAEIGDKEFVLLKNIILFSSTIGFTDSSAAVIRKAFAKYCRMLFEYQQSKFSEEPIAIERFTEAMAHPTYLQAIGSMLYSQFGRAVLCKEAGMVGKIPDELFRRS